MADGTPNFRSHGDNNRTTSTPHTRDALNAVEGLYANVAIPNDEVTRAIRENVSVDVDGVLTGRGNPSEVVRDSAQEQLRRMNRGPGMGRRVADWFQRNRPTTEQRRQERFFHAGAGDAAADLRAQREVGRAGLLDAGQIRGLIDGDGRNNQIIAILRQRLGPNIMDNMRDHPALLVALRILMQNVHGVNRDEFIQQALDGQVAPAAHGRPPEQMEQILTQAGQRIPQLQTSASAIRTGARHGLNHEIHDQAAIVNRINTPAVAGGVSPMQAAEDLVVTRQTALDAAQAALAAGTGAAAAVTAATTQLNQAAAARDRLRQELTTAEQRLHHLEELGFSLRDHAQDLLDDITRLYNGVLPTDPADVVQAIHDIEELSNHFQYNAGTHQFADDTGWNFVTNGGLQDAWDHLQHHAHDQIGHARNAHTQQHATHDLITPEMLLYRIYYRHITVLPAQGGQPGTPAMNPEQQRNLAPRAAMAVRFMLSEAKDATTLEALRVRSEIIARGRLNRRDRVQFLPDLNKILGTFRFLIVNNALPYRQLKLDKHMERSELRAAIRQAGLNIDTDIPHLIAHLQSVLRGHENKVLQGEDVTHLTNMVRNLSILRDEQKFRTVMAGSGTFDEKLRALFQDSDTPVDVDEAALFSAITDKKFVKNQEKAIIDDVTNRVRNGELSVSDAMKELKDHGIDAGRGTWSKLVAIRAGQNLKNTWKNVNGRGPFAWANRKINGALNGVKKGPSWLWNSWGVKWLRDVTSYSANPKTMSKNYNPIPPFLRGHGGGHGGGDHGGGH